MDKRWTVIATDNNTEKKFEFSVEAATIEAALARAQEIYGDRITIHEVREN